MSVVGQFPLLSDIKRRTIRAPTNPLDKSTIISIYPRHIIERKPTIQPGLFELQAGSYDKPSILVVGSSSWWKEIDENQPLLEIPQSSIQIADSVVRDYCNGILGCDMADNMPGLFYLPGEWTLDRIRKEQKDKLDSANRKQRNWFEALVKTADALWARTGGNSLAISDDMRLAANELNLVNKEWIADSRSMELVKCKACGHLKNPEFPICANCKSITDPIKAKELGLVFAQ
jgi:hypothetical protein